MKNTTINLGVVKRVASALGELNEQAVYVGGAVVSLYADDPAADDVRPTKDVDISLEIASFTELEELRLKLVDKGFSQRAETTVNCRFWLGDIMVDVMSTTAVGWAPANEWFKSGFQHIELQNVNGMPIRLLSFPYFFASKLAAFNDRGGLDPRASKDFEDIVYLLDNRLGLVNDFLGAPIVVRTYLISELEKILESPVLQEAVLSNLYHETQTVRFAQIIQKLKQIVSLEK
ncbi:MAG: hypothetical protein K9G41_00010 [Flavobacteriales bacterium]|nr:hypothetical protein [Flavobacteriales bacterium]